MDYMWGFAPSPASQLYNLLNIRTVEDACPYGFKILLVINIAKRK